MAKDQFIANMMPHAQRVSAATGIDPRIVVAQAALETGWGKSAPGNNYFGIKSHGKSGGNTLATNEVVNGQTVRINDSFRGYSGMGESADDYGRFLQQNPRYQGLLNADGIESQIAALAKSGYATDPQYGSKIASIASSLGDPVRYTAPQGGGNATMAGGEGQDTMQNTMTPFISTQGQAAPEEPKRWLDPDRRDRLILALEGMTLNPNKGLMMAAAGGLEERREGRKEQAADAQRTEQRNRTAQWLAQQGRDDLAQAVAGGMIDGKSAVQEAMKPAADDRTAMEKNYEFMVSQGIPEDQALQMARGGQTINVNNGDAPAQDGPLREQLLKKQGESWSAVVEAGTKAARATPDLEALRELAKVAPSGPMTGRLAEMFPEYNDVSAAREAIIKRVAPTLRVEGSGSTSDVEYAGMVQGMGRLTNRPEANVAIADMMIAKAELDRQRADTVRAYQTGDATYADTVSKLSELDRVSIMPDSLKSLLTAQQGQGSGGDDLSAEERKYLGLD